MCILTRLDSDVFSSDDSAFYRDDAKYNQRGITEQDLAAELYQYETFPTPTVLTTEDQNGGSEEPWEEQVSTRVKEEFNKYLEICKKEQKKKRDMSLKGHRLREKNNEEIALSNPLDRWKDSENKFASYGVQLPTLRRLVRHLYCVVATSVPSERPFSTAGSVITKSRNRLLPERADDIIFRRSNYLHKKQDQMMDPEHDEDGR